jgi:hexosaminidase
MIRKIGAFVVILFFQALFSSWASACDSINVIPKPVTLIRKSGDFLLPKHIVIATNSKEASIRNFISEFGKKVAVATGYTYALIDKNVASADINLLINEVVDKSLGNEGYNMSVSLKGIKICANEPAGLFYGLKTLLQLLPAKIESKTLQKGVVWKVPAVTIIDYPRFAWRGMLFDVSRHFFTKQQVKEFIDNMVKYKYNTLQLHLTDDQGWRLQIKGLPRLTEIGAWRAPRVGIWKEVSKPDSSEPRTYGGFYTQQDIREIIKYAADRFVNILPEIDVPGHSLAAIASYPELSCTPGYYQVNSGELLRFHKNGIAFTLVDNTLCPANKNVYVFLDTVFSEVAKLFPFQYIHIGGDECYKGFWEKSSECRQLMQENGLKNTDELQSFFIKRIEKIVESKGKKIIGWDEIQEGGLPKGAAVMSWRGMEGGIKAAKLNHPVVMSPNTFAYFDLYQGDPVAEPPSYSMVRLRKAYEFNPVPPDVDSSNILGGQCNLWSERLTTTRSAEYMLWPRALATAECLWTPVSQKDWDSFYRRVENQFKRFDAAQVKYSRSMYDPIFKVAQDNKDSLLISLETEIKNLDIYYSFDETDPDNFYPKYEEPLSVPKDAVHLKVITYRNNQQVGKLIVMPVAELRSRLAKKINKRQ